MYVEDDVLVFRRKSQVIELPKCHINAPFGKTLLRELGSMYHLTDRLEAKVVDWLPDDEGESAAFIAPYRKRSDVFVKAESKPNWRQRVWYLRQRFGRA